MFDQRPDLQPDPRPQVQLLSHVSGRRYHDLPDERWHPRTCAARISYRVEAPRDLVILRGMLRMVYRTRDWAAVSMSHGNTPRWIDRCPRFEGAPASNRSWRIARAWIAPTSPVLKPGCGIRPSTHCARSHRPSASASLSFSRPLTDGHRFAGAQSPACLARSGDSHTPTSLLGGPTGAPSPDQRLPTRR